MSIAITIYRNRIWIILLVAIVSLVILFSNLPSDNDKKIVIENKQQRQESDIDFWGRPEDDDKPSAAQAHGFSNDPNESFVQRAIQKHRVLVFSKLACPYSIATKGLLDHYKRNHGLKYHVIEVDQLDNTSNIKMALEKLYHRTTFPSIFIDGRSIGGNEDIQRMEKTERLGILLSQRGLLDTSIEDTALKTINDLIHNYKIVVFTVSDTNDKSTIEVIDKYVKKYSITHTVFKLDKDERLTALRERLFKVSGKSNFPITYIDGVPWGGAPGDMLYFEEHNKLRPFMEEHSMLQEKAVDVEPEAANANEVIPGFPEAGIFEGSAFVDAFINRFSFAVFGKSSCIHSNTLESLLKKYKDIYGIEYTLVDVDSRSDSEYIKEALLQISEYDTFPSVFVNGKYIGGNNDVYASHISGKLQELLEEEGLLTTEMKEAHQEEIHKKVSNLIEKNTVALFTKSSEQDSILALKLIQQYKDRYGMNFHETKLESLVDHLDYVNVLKKISGISGIPAVFISGKEIGGTAGLQKMYDSGELQQQLVKAKVIYPEAEGDNNNLVETEDNEDEDPDILPAEKKVRMLIKRNRIMVFSKTYCPYSKRAKILLKQYANKHNFKFKVLEADLEADPIEIKKALLKISGRATFPNIFVDGVTIGGSDELSAQHKSGKLIDIFREQRLI